MGRPWLLLTGTLDHSSRERFSGAGSSPHQLLCFVSPSSLSHESAGSCGNVTVVGTVFCFGSDSNLRNDVSSCCWCGSVESSFSLFIRWWYVGNRAVVVGCHRTTTLLEKRCVQKWRAPTDCSNARRTLSNDYRATILAVRTTPLQVTIVGDRILGGVIP